MKAINNRQKKNVLIKREWIKNQLGKFKKKYRGKQNFGSIRKPIG